MKENADRIYIEFLYVVVKDTFIALGPTYYYYSEKEEDTVDYKGRRQRNWCNTYEDVFPQKQGTGSAFLGGLVAFASSMVLLAIVSMFLK